MKSQQKILNNSKDSIFEQCRNINKKIFAKKIEDRYQQTGRYFQKNHISIVDGNYSQYRILYYFMLFCSMESIDKIFSALLDAFKTILYADKFLIRKSQHQFYSKQQSNTLKKYFVQFISILHSQICTKKKTNLIININKYSKIDLVFKNIFLTMFNRSNNLIYNMLKLINIEVVVLKLSSNSRQYQIGKYKIFVQNGSYFTIINQQTWISTINQSIFLQKNSQDYQKIWNKFNQMGSSLAISISDNSAQFIIQQSQILNRLDQNSITFQQNKIQQENLLQTNNQNPIIFQKDNVDNNNLYKSQTKQKYINQTFKQYTQLFNSQQKLYNFTMKKLSTKIYQDKYSQSTQISSALSQYLQPKSNQSIQNNQCLINTNTNFIFSMQNLQEKN